MGITVCASWVWPSRVSVDTEGGKAEGMALRDSEEAELQYLVGE